MGTGTVRTDRSPKTIARRDKRMEMKLAQLNKKHPENTYEIKEFENFAKNRQTSYKILQIKRTSGRRPHKIKDPTKRKSEVKDVTSSSVL